MPISEETKNAIRRQMEVIDSQRKIAKEQLQKLKKEVFQAEKRIAEIDKAQGNLTKDLKNG
jgi:chromosome segregation ATPase